MFGIKKSTVTAPYVPLSQASQSTDSHGLLAEELAGDVPFEESDDDSPPWPSSNKRPKSRAWIVLLVVVVSAGFVAVGYYAVLALEDDDGAVASYDHDQVASTTGWAPYQVSPESSRSALYAEGPSRPTRAQRLFSPDCADAWISRGRVCPAMAEQLRSGTERGDTGAVDVLWTWVNGSDPVLEPIREAAAAETGGGRWNKRSNVRRTYSISASRAVRKPLGDATRHFREHNELMYSMRSVLSTLPSSVVRAFHLFTSSLPSEEGYRNRIGHVPTWLDWDGIRRGEHVGPKVEVHHHFDTFKVGRGRLQELGMAASDKASTKWRESALPSFNSLAIESQLPHLDALNDTLLYMNDDMFITRQLSAADLETALYGPVFRIQPDLSVRSDIWRGTSSNLEGEWPALSYTNLLLSRRFGERDRRYIVHVAKTLSVPVAREFAAVWVDDLAQTAEARFRGRGPEVYLMYGATWYHIEKHREALLHSYLMLRADADQSGTLSLAEQESILLDLGLTSADVPSVAIASPHRSNTPDDHLHAAGLPSPRETRYSWTSTDGYPLVPQNGYPLVPQNGFKITSWPKYDAAPGTEQTACTFNVTRCLAAGFGQAGDVDSQQLFKHIAFEEPECGDCLMTALLGKSGQSGFEAFLPPESDSDAEDESVVSESIGMAKTWEDATFDIAAARANPRRFAISNILRYQYVIGDSKTQFIAIRYEYSIRPLMGMLRNASADPAAFLALNDDIVSEFVMMRVDIFLKDFFKARWGDVRGWYERVAGSSQAKEEGSGERS